MLLAGCCTILGRQTFTTRPPVSTWHELFGTVDFRRTQYVVVAVGFTTIVVAVVGPLMRTE
jgi:hypothetical protein